MQHWCLAIDESGDFGPHHTSLVAGVLARSPDPIYLDRAIKRGFELALGDN